MSNSRRGLAFCFAILFAVPLLASQERKSHQHGRLKKFKGEVFAGRFTKGEEGVALYWVFDDGVFTEYVQDLATDEIRSLAQSTYEKFGLAEGKHKAKYSIHLTSKSASGFRERNSSGLAVGTLMASQETMDFYFTDDGLTIGDELALISLDASGADVDPNLLTDLGTLYTVRAEYWGGCCDLCWAVHENMNEWRRNRIGDIDFHRFDRFCCLRTCPY